MTDAPSENGDIASIASHYFTEVFPGAQINTSSLPIPADALNNLYEAGMSMAEITNPEGIVCLATFIVRETMFTRAVFAIHLDEQQGLLPLGSHERCIDDIIAGTFVGEWPKYIVDNRGDL